MTPIKPRNPVTQAALDLEYPPLCIICLRPISGFPENTHPQHAPGCEPDEIAGCDCDMYAHAKCCPVCEKDVTQ